MGKNISTLIYASCVSSLKIPRNIMPVKLQGMGANTATPTPHPRTHTTKKYETKESLQSKFKIRKNVSNDEIQK